MDRGTLGKMLSNAIPTDTPVVSLLVPEVEFKAFVVAALEVSASPGMVDNAKLLELDRCAHRMLNLDLRLEGYNGTRRSAEVVERWLDAGCITLAPAVHIRALVKALK